jgi:hypothetical protein
MANFRYTSDEWDRVAALLARQRAPTAGDRRYLENAARNYRWFYDYTEPASQEVRIAKTHFQNVVKHSEGLLRALDALDDLPTKPSRLTSLQIAIARDPLEALAEYDAWQQQLEEMQRSAEHQVRAFPKAAKGSNRSRGDVLDDYLRNLLKFWTARGGHPGKSENSPAARFILAAAQPVLPDLEASTVSHFIRGQTTSGQHDSHVTLWRSRL